MVACTASYYSLHKLFGVAVVLDCLNQTSQKVAIFLNDKIQRIVTRYSR